MRKYHWIHTNEFPPLDGLGSLVLFGAGKGSEEALDYLSVLGERHRVRAVADNDASMWGRELLGVPIVGPSKLKEFREVVVIVTSISGRDDISRQLCRMGLVEGEHFFAVGRYPVDVVSQLEELYRSHLQTPMLSEVGSLVHVGSGGFLGLEACLAALWAERVDAVDAYRFNISYPDVTPQLEEFEDCLTLLRKFIDRHDLDGERALRRWNTCFVKSEGKTTLRQSRIGFHHPFRFSSLPFAENSVDAVVSMAVLEHVRKPREAVYESKRILKPGGWGYHRIVTRDHASFGKVKGYTPLSFRVYSPEEWDHISSRKFHQNRLAPWQWEQLFREAGFEISSYEVLDRYIPSEEELSEFHDEFRRWPRDRQVEVDCALVVRKP